MILPSLVTTGKIRIDLLLQSERVADMANYCGQWERVTAGNGGGF